MPITPVHSTIDRIKMAALCNRDFFYQRVPVHNTRDGYWVPTSHGDCLHMVPTLRQKLKYLTQHKVKQGKSDKIWTVNSTNSVTIKILHFNANSEISILGVLSMCITQRPTYHSNTEKWQCFCGNGCFMTDLTGPLRLNTKRDSTVSRHFIQSCPRPQKYSDMRKCKNAW